MRIAGVSFIAVTGLAAAFGVACGDTNPPPAAPQPIAPAANSVQSASSVEAPTAAPAPAVEVEEQRLSDRTKAPGSTRGTIACGDQRCKAGEESCLFGPESAGGGQPARFRCSREAAPIPQHFVTSRYECDDGTDCPQGETCCAVNLMAPESVQDVYACTPRKAAYACRFEPCEEGGAACPKGYSCRGRACTADVGAECGPARKRCPGDHPVCSYSSNEFKCVTEEEARVLSQEFPLLQGPGGVYRCYRTSDCPKGGSCCATMGGRSTECGGNCEATTGSVTVCTNRTECAYRTQSCAPPSVAPHIKVCTDPN